MKNYNVKPFKFFLYHLFLKYNYLYRAISFSFDPEMKYINEFTKNNDVALDIGANIGIYTRYLAKKFNKVESFEPIEQAYRYIEALNLNNVTLHKVALSNKTGRDFINVPMKHGLFRYGNSSIENLVHSKYHKRKRVPISVVTLDSYNYESLDFIKIDVEGHEMSVLEGGRNTIRKLKPNLLIEIEQRHLPANLSIYDVFTYILEKGYKGYFIEKNRLNSINNFDLQKHQVQYLEHNNEIKLSNKNKGKNYINNFFFYS
ncbi:MAG: FkbM family methyltransferase [Victivallales bacterium]|nr:FkbM family methyltransferase [Victivallales bacterium]